MRGMACMGIAACVLSAIVGCKPDGAVNADDRRVGPGMVSKPLPETEPELIGSSEEVAQGNAQFGVDLLLELAGDEPAENVFISPASIAIALAMTWNGAEGDTAQAMSEVLGLGELSREEVNSAYQALVASLEDAAPEVELAIANSIWARDGIDFQQSFLDTLSEFFEADARPVDFGDPKTPDVIDAWVDEQTRGKIPTIAPRPIPPAMWMFLINAVYFKGAWVDPFEEDMTEDAPFTLSDGTQVTVPMMRQHESFAYAETDDFQAIRLPYKGGRTSMAVVLPAKDSSLGKLMKGLDADTWREWGGLLEHQDGTIKLPKFTLEYAKGLVDPLEALGMGVAFSGDADFSGITDGAFISAVEHKTFVEVNERGTEAAAVTSVALAGGAAAPGEPFEMTVDRPFLCAIDDRETGAVLFIGTIVDPRG